MEEPKLLVNDLRTEIYADKSVLRRGSAREGEVRRHGCGARIGNSPHALLSIKTVFIQQHRRSSCQVSRRSG
jgi:hypothetical protein